MRKLFVLSVVVFLLFGNEKESNAQGLPVCELGGGTAMNKNRQLAKGESFVLTDRPLIVNLRFKPTKERPEKVGECMLPTNSKVAQKDGILQWVAECGNDEVNRNIPVSPISYQVVGPRGFDGPMGPQGAPGLKGDTGMQGAIGTPGQNAKELVLEKPKDKSFPWKKTLLILGGATIIGGAAYAKWYYSCPPGTLRR
jgi:hypothetical protein